MIKQKRSWAERPWNANSYGVQFMYLKCVVLEIWLNNDSRYGVAVQRPLAVIFQKLNNCFRDISVWRNMYQFQKDACISVAYRACHREIAKSHSTRNGARFCKIFGWITENSPRATRCKNFDLSSIKTDRVRSWKLHIFKIQRFYPKNREIWQ